MTLPTGTVTFFFTDIEGSTRLWEQNPEAMRAALARHNVLLHQAISEHEGIVFKTIGDAFCAAFASAPSALAAALAAQQTLQSEPWPAACRLTARMALHTGTADAYDGDYFGPPLNRVARLLSTGHGGQTLLSQPTYELTRDALPVRCILQDLGSHSLRDLARPEQVYQLCHPDLAKEFPPLKSLDSLPNNLPRQVTSFVGREKELTTIKILLAKTDLLTLTGSGGCGKTRLALQTAADVLDIYPDGVWLIELAPITDPKLVPQTVAGVLGVKEQTGKTYTQMLTEYLKSKTLLLVLDNCEHVLTACAKLADTLLRNCPSVKILASSREGLGIAGETSYRIPPLSLPDPKTSQTPESLSQYEAVQLFIERAAASQPAFAVTNANAPALASICHRLDGIPLALELAAARVRSLSMEEINRKLDNQFRLLTGGSRTALPRQQTLRALIDWSYDLLSDTEKALLCRLSVFIGGWTLEAAEAVCGDGHIEDWEVLDLLSSLVDKSLVQAEAAEGQTRYRFLETVRQYARDRLAEGDAGLPVRGRHRDYFLRLAEEIKPKLVGPEQGQWLSVLETEHDNLRQAITFCLEQPEEEEPDAGEKGLKLGSALQSFWNTRGHLSEGRERLTALLTRPDAQSHTRARGEALSSAVVLAIQQNDYAAARALQQEGLVIQREMGDRAGIASSLNNLGNIASDQSDFDLARSQYEQCLEIYRELGNRQGTVGCLNNMGRVASAQGDYALARSQYEACLPIWRELGNQLGIAGTLVNLGIIASDQGDYGLARSQFEESLTILRELGHRMGVASILTNLGIVAKDQGDYAAAMEMYTESLAIFRDLGYKGGVAACLINMGGVAREQGDYALARSQYAESLAINREMGDRQAMARCLSNLGMVTYDQAEYALSRSFQTESLTIRRELNDKNGIAYSLQEFALLAVTEQRAERAARLSGAAEALHQTIGSIQSAREIERHTQHMGTAKHLIDETAFTTAWAEGQAMPMEQAVEYALEKRSVLAGVGDPI